jgi:hypothetical protein
LIVSAAWSLVVYYLAMARRLPPEKVDEYVRDVYPPAATGEAAITTE